MTNNLQVFNFNNREVRSVLIDDEPYFVGKDVAEVLGYQNGSRDINRHVDEEDRTEVSLYDGVQNRNMTIINESGLYSLVLSSKLQSAKDFKRWVTKEVLPSIRKTGGYTMPKSYSDALRLLADSEEKREKLELENQIMKPKAEFYDSVADSKSAIPMAEVAKVLNFKGVGRNKLFEILRDMHILQHDNVPYQTFVDRGYFRVIEQKFNTPKGETKINIKTLVYQRGIEFIKKKLTEYTNR